MELTSISFPYLGPDILVPVLDAVLQNDRVILTLQHPGSKRLVDVPVAGAIQTSSQKYLLLELSDPFAEPPRVSFPVVRYVDRGHVSTIDFEEFRPLLALAQETDWQLLAKVGIDLFAITADAALANIEDELRKELTHEVYLGGTTFIADGADLDIIRQQLFGSSVWLTLSAESGRKHGRFLLLNIRSIGEERYCVCVYPPEQTAEDPEIKKIVLRFLAPEHLRSISSDELKAIKKELVQCLRDGKIDAVDSIERVLGRLARP